MLPVIDETVLEKIKQYYGVDRSISFSEKSLHQRLFSTIQNCEIHLSSGNKVQLCIKKYHKGCFSDIETRIKQEYVCSKKYQLKFREDSRFHIIDYIACMPDQLILISEYIKGIDLLDLSRSPFFIKKKDLDQIYFDCGKFLKKIHDTEKRYDYFDFSGLLEYVDVRLKKLLKNCNKYFNEGLRQEVIGLVESISEQYTSKKLLFVGLHGDYIPPNIRVSRDNRLFLLDFCNCKYGLIYEDLCYFLVFSFVQGLTPLSGKKEARFRNFFWKGYSTTLDQDLFNLFILKHLINSAWGTLMKIKNQEYHGIKKLYYYYVYYRLVDQIRFLSGLDHRFGYPSNFISMTP